MEKIDKRIHERILRKVLPQIGEYLFKYFEGLDNEIFKKETIDKFIKEGQIDEGSVWLLRNSIESLSRVKRVRFELKITVEDSFYENRDQNDNPILTKKDPPKSFP